MASTTKFYSALFGTAPTIAKDDYSKWMLVDPRLNFAISAGHATRGIEHLGIQVTNDDELAEVYGRLRDADRPILDAGATACCYATSTKSWIADPQGVVWETFLTNGESTVYGDAAPIASLNADTGNCCAPTLPPSTLGDLRPSHS